MYSLVFFVSFRTDVFPLAAARCVQRPASWISSSSFSFGGLFGHKHECGCGKSPCSVDHVDVCLVVLFSELGRTFVLFLFRETDGGRVSVQSLR